MTKSVAALLAALTLTLGCATLEPLTDPEVTLIDLKFTQVTLLETSAVATLRIANANPVPLCLAGGVYRLWLNGAELGKGMTGNPLEIPRLASATQDVPIHVSNLALLLRGLDIVKTNEVHYRIGSTLHLAPTHGSRRLKLTSEGTFRLAPEQAQKLQTFAPSVRME